MYGLIGKMTALSGKRSELMNILNEATRKMPGCMSYVIAADSADPNIIWVTEVWEDKDYHGASLALPEVQHAIVRARPLIVGMERVAETAPA